MSGPSTRLCLAPMCEERTNRWRQCGRCGLEIAYCENDGGDAKAVEEMTEHIQIAHSEATDR